MAVSKTMIANRALTKLGAKLIADITEASDSARTINAIFDSVRDATLRLHPWNFATKRVALAANATAPVWKWAAAFPIPADFVRMVEVKDQEPFAMEGNQILSDETGALNIVYIARVTDTAQFDALFVEALAAMLAVESVERITQSNAKKVSLERDLQVILQRARNVDGQEDDKKDFVQDDWITLMR